MRGYGQGGQQFGRLVDVQGQTTGGALRAVEAAHGGWGGQRATGRSSQQASCEAVLLAASFFQQLLRKTHGKGMSDEAFDGG